MNKKTLYIDMDNVLVDFKSGIDQLDEETKIKFDGKLDEVPDIFSRMKPIPGAVEAFNVLSEKYDTYILSTAPWENPSAWSDKVIWVKKYLGDKAWKRLILTHHKNLNQGDYLIDDRPNNGAETFEGEWIRFGSEGFDGWETIIKYLE